MISGAKSGSLVDVIVVESLGEKGANAHHHPPASSFDKAISPHRVRGMMMIAPIDH